MKHILATSVALLGLAAVPSVTAGCSQPADEAYGESSEAQTDAAAMVLNCNTQCSFAVPAVITAAGAFLSAPIVIPAAVVVTAAAIVGGAIVITVMALAATPSYYHSNGDGSITDLRTNQRIFRSPPPPSGAVMKAYSLDGTNVLFASSATATATATANAIPATKTLTEAQCRQINSDYHQPNTCDGNRDCRGVSGANRCTTLQERYDNAKRCFDLRTRYNQNCLGYINDLDARKNHISEANEASANMARCLSSAAARGYECPGFAPAAVPVSTPAPSTCDNGVHLNDCAYVGSAKYKCTHPGRNASGVNGGPNDMWLLCGAGCVCGAPAGATPSPP